MSRRRRFALLLTVVSAASQTLRASGYLFYLEAQGVAGYSSAARGAIFYSFHPEEAMQKPSLGFDYIQRFAGEYGDLAVLAVQFRLSANLEDGVGLEPQLYNGYLKLKLGPADLWAGHNRPRFGLAADLDSHALLLQPLSMHGFGFDRDWGMGLERDFSWGKGGLSLTTGSGMPLHLEGNYFFAARASRGIPERDNYSLGISAGGGRVMDVMGYHRMSDDPLPFYGLEADLTLFRDNLESRLEITAGRKAGRTVAAFLWRGGVSFLGENRLKLEVQPVWTAAGDSTRVSLAAGVSLLAAADWTIRGMIHYDRGEGEALAVIQVYYSKGLRF
jgi:hypothetical protein